MARPIDMHYHPALRERARDLRAAGLTILEIARDTGVNHHIIKAWCNGVPMPEHPEDHSESDIKTRALRLRELGSHPADIARALNVRIATVNEWILLSRPPEPPPNALRAGGHYWPALTGWERSTNGPNAR